MNSTAIVSIMLLSLALPSGAQDLELPPPPSGYAWEACQEIGGALLRPEAWSFSRVQEGETLAYFLTPHPWSPPEPFDIGLTLNVLWKVPESAGVTPSKFAERYFARIEPGSIEESWTSALGPFKGQGAIYRQLLGSEVVRLYNLIIANDKTGTAYLVVFEAPAERWQEHWSVIEPVVQRLVLDDVY